MLEFINKIFCDDCLNVMSKISDNSIDLIVTDPPYLINYKTGHRKKNDTMGFDKKLYQHDFTTVIENDNNFILISNYIKECYRIMKDNTAMYIFCNFIHSDFFKQELEKYFELRNMIIWVKNNHTAGDLINDFGRKYEIIFLVTKGIRKFNGTRLTDVWEFDKVSSKFQLHQNEKPIKLIRQCIEKHSDENDIIFDGFAGVGTTLIAAKELKRRYIGVEIDKDYCKIINDRLNYCNYINSRQSKFE